MPLPLLNIACFVITLSFLRKPNIGPFLTWFMVWSFVIYTLNRISVLGMANWFQVICQLRSVGSDACTLLRKMMRPTTAYQEELPWWLRVCGACGMRGALYNHFPQYSIWLDGKQDKIFSVVMKWLTTPFIFLVPGCGRVGLRQSHSISIVNCRRR